MLLNLYATKHKTKYVCTYISVELFLKFTCYCLQNQMLMHFWFLRYGKININTE